jgi:hypothetical protein
MKEEIQSGHVDMRCVVNVWIADIKVDRRETVSCQVTTEACLGSKELNPEGVESEVEHREIPTEEVAMKSAGKKKKQHRGRYLAARRRGERKELTRGDCGSRRKVSRREAVAWLTRNFFRKIRTQGNCGPRKELAAADRRMTKSTKWHGARDSTRTMWYKNPGKDGHSGRDVRIARNATMA